MLQSWEQCRGIDQYTFRFIIGKQPDEGIVELINKAALPHKELVFCTSGSAQRDIGEAWQQAASDSPDYFLYNSGDERVSRDHLEICEQVVQRFQEPKLLNYSGRGIRHCPKDNGLLVRAHGSHPQGMLMFTEPFIKYILPYLTEEYYRSEYINPWDDSISWYMDYFIKNFPETNWRVVPPGLDGLVDVICRKHGLVSLTSIATRSQEISWVGGRKRGNSLKYEEIKQRSLAERIALVGRVLEDNQLIEAFSQHAEDCFPDWQPDHEPVELRVVDMTEVRQ